MSCFRMLFASSCCAFLALTPVAAAPPQTPMKYPATDRTAQADNYHGRVVPDPYRWLEDTDSSATKAWIAAQNAVTAAYLAENPLRERIRARLKELWDYERFGTPRQRGGRYFFTRNDGLQNQSVLYVADSLDAEPRVLIDPNRWSADGTTAMQGWVPSPDGQWLAYSVAVSGSDWRRWQVREVATGEDLADEINWVKFSSVSWARDNGGFYYSRYEAPQENAAFSAANYYQQLYFHELGEPQARDRLIYQRADEKEWGFDAEVSEDGRFLIIEVWRGSERKNQIFYRDLSERHGDVVELISGFDGDYSFVGNEGPLLYLHTDQAAPRKRLIAVDIRRPQQENWITVIPESTSVLAAVTRVGNSFVARYLERAAARVRLFDLQGGLQRDVSLPGIGSVEGFTGQQGSNETFYRFSNFSRPATIYRLDVTSGVSRLFREPQLHFDPATFETRQVTVTSRDGTAVPMFLTHKRELSRDEPQPTMLFGYGGFNISLTPTFSVSNLVWLELGGILAVPNLRGGGEFGRDWHEAGMGANKQNVFDDFIAAAEWLIEQGYTSPRQLAIRGRSNGGLLVGAVMTQRPELSAVALPAVGVMDMLRYHKFTIGWAWVGEYGSSDDPEQFATLLKYSPLHQLRPGVRYPATLVTTADHDDRVVPGHSFKFAAALQHAQAGPRPVLIRIESRAGHGSGTPTSKLIALAADELSFAAAELGME